jgi:hypothetical protein
MIRKDKERFECHAAVFYRLSMTFRAICAKVLIDTRIIALLQRKEGNGKKAAISTYMVVVRGGGNGDDENALKQREEREETEKNREVKRNCKREALGRLS